MKKVQKTRRRREKENPKNKHDLKISLEVCVCVTMQFGSRNLISLFSLLCVLILPHTHSFELLKTAPIMITNRVSDNGVLLKILFAYQKIYGKISCTRFIHSGCQLKTGDFSNRTSVGCHGPIKANNCVNVKQFYRK